MNKDIILGIVRHALTFGGGIIGSKGLAENDEITAAVSAVVTIIGFAWSIASKRAAAKKAATPAA